jgi:hypothetical protein
MRSTPIYIKNIISIIFFSIALFTLNYIITVIFGQKASSYDNLQFNITFKSFFYFNFLFNLIFTLIKVFFLAIFLYAAYKIQMEQIGFGTAFRISFLPEFVFFFSKINTIVYFWNKPEFSKENIAEINQFFHISNFVQISNEFTFLGSINTLNILYFLFALWLIYRLTDIGEHKIFIISIIVFIFPYIIKLLIMFLLTP